MKKQDEIIEMAQECQLIGMRPHLDGIYIESLLAFANLIAAKEQKKWQDQTAVEIHEAVLEEREACAKMVDARLEKWLSLFGKDKMYKWMLGLPKAIRARGEA